MNRNNQIIMQRETVKGAIQNKAFFSFLNSISYAFTGRIHFVKERIGEVVTTDNGQEYKVFRHVIVDPKYDHEKKSKAILRICFDFAHGSPDQNKRLSLIPIPFIVGLPGFRSKIWAINNESGGFQGIYKWDTIQDAEIYKRSFAIKLMTKRAIPGSITFQIIPQ